ncbi:uncharacterized protein MELLADRAFT_124416 [Melampsora larici-populina 98AG31]|uniref:Secreted protein n=1 Tax=Melampsora larici-populina (strain 98AG31 / pathotype 3-4-7) TaxID=747676 RepID=F4RL84_MELLP|nr:uncharacterized protein MELLADRAFT_124416 [Melampsora larici-populina 98AG31]EGG06863.1 secreted protein [Melampsora larici-populina 98AG31]
MKKCINLAILCFMLLTLFSTFSRAEELVVRCCDRANYCSASENIEDSDCGTNPDGTSIPYICERIHQTPLCPNDVFFNQTCRYGAPACELPVEDDDE